MAIAAYEIHMGVTEWTSMPGGSGHHPLFLIEADCENSLKSEEDTPIHLEGLATADGRVWGSYLHGLFDNDAFRRSWLNGVRGVRDWMPFR